MFIIPIALVIVTITLILISVGIWFLKPKMYEISEEERYVIYQHGIFDRVIGPGPVWVWEGSENIKRKINVRNEPKDIVINELFIYDIPFGYKLNFWSRFDPAMLRNLNPTLMAELLQFDDNERHQQVLVKVRDAVVNSIVKLQDDQGGMPDSLIAKILLIAPGLNGYNTIMQHVRDELEQTLPAIGIRLDRRQPITTTKLYLRPEIINILNQERTAEHIEKIIPGVSTAEKLQPLSRQIRQGDSKMPQPRSDVVSAGTEPDEISLNALQSIRGKQIRELNDSICDAYHNVDELKMAMTFDGFLDDLIIGLDSSAKYNQLVFNLIMNAKKKGKLGGLINALYVHTPGNPKLRMFVETYARNLLV